MSVFKNIRIRLFSDKALIVQILIKARRELFVIQPICLAPKQHIHFYQKYTFTIATQQEFLFFYRLQ